jgi:hypothetical protein
MKKILMHFSENILSRSQMKAIKGGEEYGGSACTRCYDNRDYICSIQTHGGCECNVAGLGRGCVVIV